MHHLSCVQSNTRETVVNTKHKKNSFMHPLHKSLGVKFLSSINSACWTGGVEYFNFLWLNSALSGQADLCLSSQQDATDIFAHASGGLSPALTRLPAIASGQNAPSSVKHRRFPRLICMKPFLGELIGTALLVLLGDGVVANVLLKGRKEIIRLDRDHTRLGAGGVCRRRRCGSGQRCAFESCGDDRDGLRRENQLGTGANLRCRPNARRDDWSGFGSGRYKQT